MTHTEISTTELLQVNRPAQYLGGEKGSITKREEQVTLRMCLAFPDTYEVGMSHTGYQILYDLLNRRAEWWAERVYVPLPDMEALLRSKGAPLRSLESKRCLTEFDWVGFSLQYELCMSGILSILDLGKIPLLQRDRNEAHPLIIGGGPVAYHPEPFSDFFDAFLIGDGEELVLEFNEKLAELKAQRASRSELLEQLSFIKGVYIPSFFDAQSSPEKRFVTLRPTRAHHQQIERRVLASLEDAPFPENPLVPNIQAVHDRLSVEVMRGCVRGCRFCQAGYLYRPQRERSPEQIREIVRKSLQSTGHEELSLLSLSTADYCSILPLLSVLKEEFAQEDNVAISFPSTRVDALTPELLQEVQPIRRSGFTMAPEAGTQRLRDVINKGVTDEQIIETCKNVFTLGWSSVKLYFMIGLPTETDEDVAGIIDIARRVKAIAGRGKQVTVSVSTHVPKPHTPFQWAEQISEGETVRKQQYLYRELKQLGVTFRYHDAKASVLEGVFARGDRRLGKVILKAYERGTRLDGWMEELQYERWMQAFEEAEIEPENYLAGIDPAETLPWDHISCDIPKRWFLKEWQRALAIRTTPDCLTQTCSTCGACDYDATRNVLFDRERTESRLNIINPPWQAIIEKRQGGQTTHLLERVSNTNGSLERPEQDGGYQLKEYLKTEVEARKQSLYRPAQETKMTVRLRYAKRGPLCFIGHLELMRSLFRATRRANLPVVFTKGFHPKPKFAFGPPLQLGIESSVEFVDMALFEELPIPTLLERLNSEAPEGFEALEGEPLPPNGPSLQSLLQSASYRVSLEPRFFSEKQELIDPNWRAVSVERKRKGKVVPVKVDQFVSRLEKLNHESFEFDLLVNDRGATLKPLEVVAAVSPYHFHLFHVEKTAIRLLEA